MTTRAGIRELRLYLSRYIDQVKDGETIEVTERGRLVAALVPRTEDDPAAALEARGLRVTRPRTRFDELGPTPDPPPGQSPLSELLREQREHERY